MEKFLKNLQLQAEDNPFIAIGVGIAALTAVSKFIDVIGETGSRRTHAKEVKRRVAISKHKK